MKNSSLSSEKDYLQMDSQLVFQSKVRPFNVQIWWWRGDGLGLFCSHMTWKTCSHWNIDELHFIEEHSQDKSEAVCP